MELTVPLPSCCGLFEISAGNGTCYKAVVDLVIERVGAHNLSDIVNAIGLRGNGTRVAEGENLAFLERKRKELSYVLIIADDNTAVVNRERQGGVCARNIDVLKFSLCV